MSHKLGFYETIRIDKLGFAQLVRAIPATISKGTDMSQAPQQQPVASAISAISDTQQHTARSCGSRWGKNKLERLEVAREYSRSLGENPTILQWEAHRIEFVNGYVESNPDNMGNSADVAWKEFAAYLYTLFSVQKPTGPKSEGAKKKREERAKKQEAILAKYEDKSAADLRGMRAAALQKAAAGSEIAEKIAAELKKVLRIKTADENAEIAEERKELRAQVRSAAGKCTDLDKLRAALEILDDDTDLEFITEVEADEDYASDPGEDD